MAKKDLYKNTDYFEFTQPNPTEGKRCKKPDCVIRAFAIAANLSWQESYDILSALARENYDVPNSQNIYEKAFAQRGYKKISMKPIKGEKRKTAEDFAKSNPKGRYILGLASHLCAVVDGKIRDGWNCGYKCIYKIYIINEK